MSGFSDAPHLKAEDVQPVPDTTKKEKPSEPKVEREPTKIVGAFGNQDRPRQRTRAGW